MAQVIHVEMDWEPDESDATMHRRLEDTLEMMGFDNIEISFEGEAVEPADDIVRERKPGR